jgi:hypothetical protein
LVSSPSLTSTSGSVTNVSTPTTTSTTATAGAERLNPQQVTSSRSSQHSIHTSFPETRGTITVTTSTSQPPAANLTGSIPKKTISTATGEDFDNSTNNSQFVQTINSEQRNLSNTNNSAQNFRNLRQTKIASMPVFAMVLWLWFMILPRSMATQDHVHYGIMFQEESLIKFTTEYWLHTYVIGLPKIYTLQTLPFCKRCDTKNIMTANVNMLCKNILHTVHETRELIDVLIPNTNTS